jgi:fatty-acid desaturase
MAEFTHEYTVQGTRHMGQGSWTRTHTDADKDTDIDRDPDIDWDTDRHTDTDMENGLCHGQL